METRVEYFDQGVGSIVTVVIDHDDYTKTRTEPEYISRQCGYSNIVRI